MRTLHDSLSLDYIPITMVRSAPSHHSPSSGRHRLTSPTRSGVSAIGDCPPPGSAKLGMRHPVAGDDKYSMGGGSSFGGGALSAEQQEQMVRSIYTNGQMTGEEKSQAIFALLNPEAAQGAAAGAARDGDNEESEENESSSNDSNDSLYSLDATAKESEDDGGGGSNRDDSSDCSWNSVAIESMSLGNGSGWGWFTAAEDTPASNNLGESEWQAAEDARLNAVGAFGEGRDESQHEELVAPHRQSRHHDQQRGADRRPPARQISASPPLLLDCGEDGSDLIVAPHQLLMATGGSLREAVEFERQHTSTTPPRSLANSFYEHA